MNISNNTEKLNNVLTLAESLPSADASNNGGGVAIDTCTVTIKNQELKVSSMCLEYTSVADGIIIHQTLTAGSTWPSTITCVKNTMIGLTSTYGVWIDNPETIEGGLSMLGGVNYMETGSYLGSMLLLVTASGAINVKNTESYLNI